VYGYTDGGDGITGSRSFLLLVQLHHFENNHTKTDDERKEKRRTVTTNTRTAKQNAVRVRIADSYLELRERGFAVEVSDDRNGNNTLALFAHPVSTRCNGAPLSACATRRIGGGNMFTFNSGILYRAFQRVAWRAVAGAD